MQVSYDSLTGQKKYKVSGLNSETISELKSLITKKDSVVAITSPTQFRVLAEDKSVVEFESEKPESLSHWLKEFDILNYDFMKQPHDYIISVDSAHASSVLINNDKSEPHYYSFSLMMKEYSGQRTASEIKKAILGSGCNIFGSSDGKIPMKSKDPFRAKDAYSIPHNNLKNVVQTNFETPINSLQKYFDFFKSQPVLIKISDSEFNQTLVQMNHFSNGCHNGLFSYNLLPTSFIPSRTHCFDSVSRVTKSALGVNYADYLESSIYTEEETESNSASLFYLKFDDANLFGKASILYQFSKTIIKKLYSFVYPDDSEYNLHEYNLHETQQLELEQVFKCKNSQNVGYADKHTFSFGRLEKIGEDLYCLSKTYLPEEKCLTFAKFEDNFVHEIDCEKEIIIDENQCWYEG